MTFGRGPNSQMSIRFVISIPDPSKAFLYQGGEARSWRGREEGKGEGRVSEPLCTCTYYGHRTCMYYDLWFLKVDDLWFAKVDDLWFLKLYDQSTHWSSQRGLRTCARLPESDTSISLSDVTLKHPTVSFTFETTFSSVSHVLTSCLIRNLVF